jgi:hypothetical protein
MRPVCALALASFLTASVSSFAQDSGTIQVQRPPVPPARTVPRGSVAGHVYLADTHSPARGARIMLLPAAEFGIGDGATPSFNGDQQMAVTALDGSFLLPHVASGQYIVLAFAAGYLSPLDGLQVEQGNNQADMKAMGKKLLENAPVVRVTGAEAARIDIDLQRGAILSGRVVYSDGAPASQLSISVQKAAGASKPSANPTMDVGAVMRTLFLQQRMSTDDEGRFRIAGIQPGSYCVAVAQNFAAGTDMGEVMMAEFNPLAQQTGRLTVYSGNTLHRKDAKMYDLKAGDVVDGIEITLPLNGLHAIRGTVAGKDGTPLNSGNLDLADTADSSIIFHANVEVDGEFRFSGVPEGNYQLKASSGRILENPPTGNVPEEVVQNDPQQFKPMRAFADTTVSVAVQTTDIEGLIVTLPETKLPDLPKPPQFLMPGQTGAPNQPTGPGPQ